MSDTETPLRTIQIANTPSGEYDVHKPMPYPYHVEPDGSIARQDIWKGEPARLEGFQRDADVQHVDVLAESWLADPNCDVTGMFPVFSDADGTMWNSIHPVVAR